MVTEIRDRVDVLPLLAPLLSVKRYAISLSFNPHLYEHATEKPLHYTVTCYSNTRAHPVTLEVCEPMLPSAHLFDLSSALRARAPEEEFEKGYFLIRRDLHRPDGQRLFYKHSLWVSYTTSHSYLILSATVQFASSRMLYNPEQLSRVVEYFGHVVANDRMTTVMVVSNPYPGDTKTTLALFADGRREPVGTGHFTIRQRTAEHLDLEPLIPADFRGTPLVMRAVSNHRLISAMMYYDKQARCFYAADHTLPWQVLF